MSGASPRCRVKIAFGQYRVGDEISPGAMLRNDLLRRGWIEIVETNGAEEVIAVGTAAVSEEPPIKKRGRPRRSKPCIDSTSYDEQVERHIDNQEAE